MKGQLRLVADRLAIDVWQPLAAHEDSPEDLLGELYRSLSPFLVANKANDLGVADQFPVAVAEALESADDAFRYLLRLGPDDFESESDVLGALAASFDALADFEIESVSAEYVELLRVFTDRYSLRYYVDDAGVLWFTFPGLVASLFGELRRVTGLNDELRQLMADFEHALAECMADPLEDRIKTVVQKQFNLLEALGMQHDHVNKNSFSAICDEVDTWPHNKIRDAAKAIYSFACDYPGIRHGGTYESAIRPLDLRDLVGITVAMTGLVSYIAVGLDATTEGVICSGDGHVESAAAPWLIGPTGNLVASAP